MPTKSDPRSKAQKLIALALSSNKNEARNAAVSACKLISEHKLLETPAMPRVTVATAAEAAEKVRNVANDPAVRAGAAQAADVLRAGADFLGKAGDLFKQVRR